MTEPYYTTLRALHMGGVWLAFAVAPVVLLARKGGHRHIIYGRCFLLAFTVGIMAPWVDDFLLHPFSRQTGRLGAQQWDLECGKFSWWF